MAIQATTAERDLLQSDETFGTVAQAIILSRYGEESLDWDPLTVALELKADYEADISPVVMDRWCAMQVVMGSDAFFKRIDAFISVCNTLSSGDPFFEAFNPVTPEEAAWAITEVSMNRDMLPFSQTIREYIRKSLPEYGFGGENYPEVFDEVFDSHPDASEIRDGIVSAHNKGNIQAFLGEQAKSMAYQFSLLPEFKGKTVEIFKSGIMPVLGGN